MGVGTAAAVAPTMLKLRGREYIFAPAIFSQISPIVSVAAGCLKMYIMLCKILLRVLYMLIDAGYIIDRLMYTLIDKFSCCTSSVKDTLWHCSAVSDRIPSLYNPSHLSSSLYLSEHRPIFMKSSPRNAKIVPTPPVHTHKVTKSAESKSRNKSTSWNSTRYDINTNGFVIIIVITINNNNNRN